MTMTTQEALLSLAGSTASAAGDVLGRFAHDGVHVGEVAIPLPGRDPFETPLPAIVAVQYLDGVQGGNVFVLPLRAGRRLAAAMAGEEGEPAADGPLTDEELAAVTQAMTEMMAAAAAVTTQVLGREVDLDPPTVKVAETAREVKVAIQGATRTTIAEINLLGEPCRFIQLVPSVFTMRITQALASGPAVGSDDTGADALRETMRSVPLRVWAELGRARLRTLEVAALADGAIVDLDRGADDPVDIYVNGSRIAIGRLIRVDDKDWAVRLEEVFPTALAPIPTKGTP
jgi:flagellar motor switch protein FliN/FliY